MGVCPTSTLLATDGSKDAEFGRIQAAQRAARKVLEEQSRRIEHLGDTVAQALLKTGSVAREIVETAEELGIDLVAVGSRGRGAMKRALLSGVSNTVVRQAPCPVMIVRRGGLGGRRANRRP